jgi:hypothetical protein
MVEAMVNIATNGALDRIDQRGKRARELYRWGLHPHHAEAGSPLATDNASFEAAYPLALSGGVGVTEESLFPLMSAAENLNAAGLLIEQRSRNRNVHAMPVMQLCRSAMESSARTIWILGDPECEVRRDRALSVLVEQLEQQKRFLIIADASVTSGPNQLPSNLVAMNRAHQQKQADLVKRLRDNYTVAKPESFSKTIGLAAEWVDKRLPAHDTGELAANGLGGGAKMAYSWGSGFVHGYKWAVDYVPGVRLFGMIADSLAAAINMTECAVALYEAVCRAPGDERNGDATGLVSRSRPVIDPARLPIDIDNNSPEQAASDTLNGIECRECRVDRLGPDRDHDARHLVAYP